MFDAPALRNRARVAALALAAAAAPALASADDGPSVDALVTQDVIDAARKVVTAEIVHRAVSAQNAAYGDLSQPAIDALDQQWRAEREADEKPLIAQTLSNPLSSYLTRVQATDLGLYAAIFVVDKNGLNVGQSAVTGDYWQGDEAKFTKTFPNGAGAVFVDAPEWVDEFNVWIAQINLTVVDGAGAPIGAATFDVNLTELERRAAAEATN